MIKVDNKKTEISGNMIELLAEAVLVVDGVANAVAGKGIIPKDQIKKLICSGVDALDSMKDGKAPQEASEDALKKYFDKK